MKTSSLLSLLVVTAFAGASLAAENDALLSFSTRGPDTYSDGTPVLDGECYALVWTAAGSDGLRLAADGSAEGGEIVLVAPLAKEGRCPKVLFEVDAATLKEKYDGGSWSVYLLDTRRWAADGSVAPAGTVNGKVRLVNAAGAVSGASVALAEAGTLSAELGTSAAETSAVPEGTPKPVIQGIRVEGAYVFVTVKGTAPYLQYGLLSGETLDEGLTADGAPQTGADSTDDEIVFVAPADADSGFFRVGRRTQP